MTGDDTMADLAEVVAAYLAAEADLTVAEEARSAAHLAHVATIPMEGRLRVGAGDDRTRLAHHAACTRVVAAQLEVTRAERAVVSAAVEHVAVSAPTPAPTAPDAAHGASGSNPDLQKADS